MYSKRLSDPAIVDRTRGCGWAVCDVSSSKLPETVRDPHACQCVCTKCDLYSLGVVCSGSPETVRSRYCEQDSGIRMDRV